MQSSTNVGFTKRLFRRQGGSSPSQSPSEERKMPSLLKQMDSEPAFSLRQPSSEDSPCPTATLRLPTPPSAPTPTSPRLQRRFQWKLFEKAPFFNKTTTSVPARNPKICIRQASLDQPDAEEDNEKRPSFCSLEDSIADDPASVDGAETIDFDSSMENKQGGSKFPLRKLRPKPSSTSSSVDTLWKSVDSSPGRWRSVEGLEVEIGGTRLEYLSEVERQALAKIAMQRLQRLQLGCAITQPKDNPLLKQRRQKYLKKKAHTVNVVEKRQGASLLPWLHTFITTTKHFLAPQHTTQQQVFGVPLCVCIENDQRNEAEQRCKSLDLNEANRISPQGTPHQSRVSSYDSSKSSLSEQLSSESLGVRPASSSSRGSLSNPEQDPDTEKKYTSSENLLLPVNFGGQSSPTRVSLSPRGRTSSSSSVFKDEAYQPRMVQVPKIVEACTTYLKRHGLSTVGIFRVDGSAKRCRQLRVMLDSGREIIFSDSEELEHQPQDIATLLKQYLRDLPDPLLTKELYNAFIAVTKLSEDKRLETLRCLMALLPNANADTLLVLLKFLEDVTKHSFDTISDQGILISGNRMNARNLATIFGPSLLRSDSTKPQQNLADNDSVIDIVETMISDVDKIFTIPVDFQQQMLKVIQDTDPDGLDRVIRSYRERAESLEAGETQEEMQTAVFYTSQEESCPEEVIREQDGSTTIKTKQISTHRIIYKVHKPSDKVLISRSAGEQELDDRAGKLMGEKFSDLDLFIDDDCATAGETEPLNLIDPTVKPSKSTPLSKLSGVVWPSKESKKDSG